MIEDSPSPPIRSNHQQTDLSGPPSHNTRGAAIKRRRVPDRHSSNFVNGHQSTTDATMPQHQALTAALKTNLYIPGSPLYYTSGTSYEPTLCPNHQAYSYQYQLGQSHKFHPQDPYYGQLATNMISGKRKRDFPSGLYPAELQSQGSVGRAFTYQHLAFGSNAASHGKDREVILRRIPDSHCATNKSRWDDSEGHYIIVDDTDITPRCKQAYHQAVA